MQVAYQPDGGFVVPERCIVAHVEGALARGPTLRARERVLEWDETESGVRVRTERGVVEAERLVLTAGAWSDDVARLAAGSVKPVRQVLAWFQPTRPELFTPERMPVFNLILDGDHFYGFPAYGIPGVKLGRYERQGESGDPDGISRVPTVADEVRLREFAEPLSSRTEPGRPSRSRRASSSSRPTSTSSSTGTRTHRQPIVGAGFSGHGYKFCSVSARSSPTSRSTEARATTSGSSASTASRAVPRLLPAGVVERQTRRL